MGYDVWHLCEVPGPLAFTARIKTLIKQIIKLILAFAGVGKFRRQFQQKTIMPLVETIFSNFQNKYITQRITMTQEQAINAPSSQWNEYDYAITGSDQVWNLWRHTKTEADYYYLSFMPREKRVCYAPSFGFSEFPESDYEFHKQGLLGLDCISCREQEMIPMIKSISGKDARLVLDPTLLLTAEQWREYETAPGYDVPDKYVLCYFLGNKPGDYMEAIREAAGSLPVISLLDIGDKAHIPSDPGAFLWLIDHADFVCTDSFHGTAFSVNFGKEFMAFRRRQKGMEDMFGRIDSLLTHLGITDHIYGEGVRVRPEPVDYDDAYSKLEALRESSMDYLRECLK